MIYSCETVRRLVGAIAVCTALTLSSTTSVWAANTQTAQTKISSRPTVDEAVAIALSDKTVSADQQALATRFVAVSGMDHSFTSTVDELWDPLREKITAGFPEKDKIVFTSALDEAMAATKADILGWYSTSLDRYYAAIMTPEELIDLTNLYESPLGRRMLDAPEKLTEADRRAKEEYIQSHAALKNGSSGRIAGVKKLEQALFAQPNDAFFKSFTARFCQSVERRGATFPACTTLNRRQEN